MGRKPVPTEILKLRGSRRANNRAGEVAFSPAELAAPVFLSEESKAEWDRLAPILCGVGCLAEPDLAVLTVYCVAWGDYCEAVRKIKEEGYTSETPNGYAIQSVWVNLRDKASKTLMSAGAELGLSPSARTRIRVETPKEAGGGIMSRKRQA